jgi:hypothetical protein
VNSRRKGTIPRLPGGRAPDRSPRRNLPCVPVGLDYWIWSGRLAVLGSSLSDPFARLPARALSARLPDGADPAPGIQGRRAPGAPARERGAAPPDRPGPLPAGRPAVAGSTVATGPAPAMGRGVHGDPGDAARLASAAGRPQVGLRQPAPSRSAVNGSRDPQARDRHRDGQSGLGASAGARRTRQARPPDRGLHGLADPAGRRYRPRAAPQGPDLEAVSDRPGPAASSPSTSSTWTPCCCGASTP